MADTLPGYPQSEGAKVGSVIEWTGPASYTQVTPGSTPTGGQAITAKDFGLKYIEFVDTQLDATGTYEVLFTPTVSGKQGVTAGILMWRLAATGVEMGAQSDLDAYKVRLRAIGLD